MRGAEVLGEPLCFVSQEGFMLYRAEISSTMDYKEDHTHAISY
jgi:hypothetical protein